MGEPSAEQRDAIYRWVEESPQHAVAFAAAEAAWEQAERLKAVYPPAPEQAVASADD
ncbi:DUF4880 domain-containing protein [Sphingomonas faeni]|uniref:DUF4880 domain-containing protein n=1 Tax=Sphingomonas faeni TaxID=185950 RepID=UPI00336181E4